MIGDGERSGERGVHALLHLRRRHVLLARGEVPLVAEGVGEHPDAVAEELVLDRAQQRRARRGRARDDGVDVRDVQVQRDRRAAERRGAERPKSGYSSASMKRRVADLQLGVADLPPGSLRRNSSSAPNART